MSRIVPFSLAVFAVSSLCLAANQVVHVKKSGAERVVVTVETSEATPAAKAFNTLWRPGNGSATSAIRRPGARTAKQVPFLLNCGFTAR